MTPGTWFLVFVDKSTANEMRKMRTLEEFGKEDTEQKAHLERTYQLEESAGWPMLYDNEIKHS
jgi:hypothetical protein